MKKLAIVICMILLMGCSHKQGISIYKDLDAKQTYEKLLEKMNGEVKYVKREVDNKDGFYEEDIYKIDNSVVALHKAQFKNDETKQYAIFEKNNKYRLSDYDNDGIYSLESEKGDGEVLFVLSNIFDHKEIEAMDINRKDTDGKIILEMKYINNAYEVTKMYGLETLIIGEDGFLESSSQKYFTSDSYDETDGAMLVEHKTKMYDYNLDKTLDFNKEVESIKSLDGANQEKVEKEIFKK